MAELKYTKDGRLLFTKEMKKEYLILAPEMLEIHFQLLEAIFKKSDYRFEVIRTTGQSIIDAGLKHVHNDICYPALLVIGQLIDALKSGKYDLHKVALCITQTGGGCRASNYIHLIRKALKHANLEFIPIISLSVGGLEKNPGFKMSLPLIKKMNAAVLYGDMLMTLRNYKMRYEVVEGETHNLLQYWIKKLVTQLDKKKPPKKKECIKTMKEIVADFDAIAEEKKLLPRVGVVGEIYVKFAPLGNNNLEEFLFSEGAEVVIPGLYNFLLFKIDVRIIDRELYGGKRISKWIYKLLMKKLYYWQDIYNDIINASKTLPHQSSYRHLKDLAKDYAGIGNKMGEGWLLVAEMLELIEMGAGNIVCAQPFGCLPNHIIGKGVIKRIHENHPKANIVPIDYDPGASRVNQENRIKLMLAAAKEKLK